MLEPFPLHIADHILFLLLGLVLPFRAISGQKKLKDIHFNSRMRVALYIGNSLGLWLLALAVLALWWWLDRPVAFLGLTWTSRVATLLSIASVAFFFALYLFDTWQDVFTAKGRQEVEERLAGELGILPRTPKSYLYFIPLACSAGICEEIVFRGFFISYFVSLFGNSWPGYILAISIPALIFGIVHTYQGRQAMIKIVGMAVIFGLMFLLTGSIVLLIILHITVDLIGGSVGLFFPEETGSPAAGPWPTDPVVMEEE